MRRLLVCAALIAMAVPATGCSATSTSSATSAKQSANTDPAVVTSAEPAAPTDPKIIQACKDARQVTNDATAKFSSELDKAIDSGDTGDTAGQAAAMDQLRATFKDWAAKLRQQVGAVTDPQLKSVLAQYAGAVDAAIAQIKSPTDLERLSTFDDQELDTVASRFQQVCGA
jgi:hypothetical protein